MIFTTALAAVAAFVPSTVSAAHVWKSQRSSSSIHARDDAITYTIAQNYSGPTFFDVGWAFTTGPDTTNWGNVIYLSQADAKAQNLTYVNEAGNAVIKVDNVTASTDPTYGRSSIYMVSTGTFYEGSLVIFSATHMPYGCGVWPGFWSLGGNASNWPLYGEIDIMENVNMASTNQYSLHTENGCKHPPGPANPAVETGIVGNPDCYNGTLYNTGCIVVESKPNNYGAGFAQNGGGAYAVQWTTSAINIWFFPRASIPGDLASESPNPAGWGVPSAVYPQSTCNFQDFFGPQAIILDIDLCGLYAGEPNIFNAGGLCQGLCTDLIHNPNNFNTAYFEIEFLRVFVEANGTQSPIPSTTASGSSSTTSPTVISGHAGGSGAASPGPSATWLGAGFLALMTVALSSVLLAF